MKLRSVLISIPISLVLGLMGCQSKPWRFQPHLPIKISTRQPLDSKPHSSDSKLKHVANIVDSELADLSGLDREALELPSIRLTSDLTEINAQISSSQGVADGPPELDLQGVNADSSPSITEGTRIPDPVAGLFELPSEFRDLSLGEVVALTLTDRVVLRSLSGTVIRNPASVGLSLDPEIQRSDANFGIDAAESQFDPLITGSSSYANNDDFFNNPSTTGNAAEVQQDLTRLSFGVEKLNEYGTRFALNPGIIHDSNNNPRVFFPNSWESVVEATIAQPLLQGRGTDFNRIAGPNSRPGFLGTAGIEISRIDNQVEYSRFERGVREYVLEIVNAYWQLDLAYKNYSAIRAVRDTSFETWQVVKAKYENGLPGGEADREAQARGQYIQFEIQLDQALNAVRAGQVPGVLQAEANLRRLMNLPQSDGLLLRPTDEPSDLLPSYDWDILSQDALVRRAELKEQRQRVERADLLTIAAKNFTLPRLDAIATYRLSGLGDDLIGSGGKFAGALNETWDANYEEVEVGLSYEAPAGQRRAKAGLRNARLQSTRERIMLEEMEQQIIHELGTAYRSAYQTNRTIELATLRRSAARETFLARKAAYESDAAGFEDLLEAQRLYLDAELALQSALTAREQAIYQLESERGTLLDDFTINVAQ